MSIVWTLIIFGLAQQPDEFKEIEAGREFRLAIGQSAKLKDDGLVIAFDSVSEDSRCPEGVNCVWSGNAKIMVSLKNLDGEPIPAEINTDVEPREYALSGYKIRLIDLLPRPKADESADAKKYEAILLLSKHPH